MKCISLWQPWATLIIAGAKLVETRSWKTSHRGPLAIHAGKRFPPELRDLCQREPFRSALRAAGHADPDSLPRGHLLGHVELLDCQPTHEIESTLTKIELAFGDYSPGRWGWLLSNPHPLVVPILMTGQRALWEIDDELMSANS